jgi:hypothetical protein
MSIRIKFLHEGMLCAEMIDPTWLSLSHQIKELFPPLAFPALAAGVTVTWEDKEGDALAVKCDKTLNDFLEENKKTNKTPKLTLKALAPPPAHSTQAIAQAEAGRARAGTSFAVEVEAAVVAASAGETAANTETEAEATAASASATTAASASAVSASAPAEQATPSSHDPALPPNTARVARVRKPSVKHPPDYHCPASDPTSAAASAFATTAAPTSASANEVPARARSSRAQTAVEDAHQELFKKLLYECVDRVLFYLPDANIFKRRMIDDRMHRGMRYSLCGGPDLAVANVLSDIELLRSNAHKDNEGQYFMLSP